MGPLPAISGAAYITYGRFEVEGSRNMASFLLGGVVVVGGILMMPGLEPLSPARDHFLRIWEGSKKKKNNCQGREPSGLGWVEDQGFWYRV